MTVQAPNQPAVRKCAATRPARKPKVDPTFAKLKLACEALENEKSLNLRVMDVRGVTLIADYFVIAAGTSSVHLNAIAIGVQEHLRDHGFRGRVEGKGASGWTLLDYGDVIVHVFSSDLRELYDLEHLWADAVASDWPGNGAP